VFGRRNQNDKMNNKNIVDEKSVTRFSKNGFFFFPTSRRKQLGEEKPMSIL
jgi:hypothetical protein